jgi:hypothetical protein
MNPLFVFDFIVSIEEHKNGKKNENENKKGNKEEKFKILHHNFYL